MKRKLIAAIGIAGMMVSIAACGDSDRRQRRTTPGADAKELTVWLTVDAQNNWPELVKAADAALVEGEAPRHQDQPRVLRLAATRTPSSTPSWPPTRPPTWSRWATPRCSATWSRAPSPRSTRRSSSNSAAWLDGLKDSVTYDGKTYGVPYYAGGRVAQLAQGRRRRGRREVHAEDVRGAHRRPGQDPEEGGRQVQRLVPAQPRLVRGHVLRLRRRRLDRQGGRRPVEGQPLLARSPSRASTSSRRSSTSTCTATRPRTSPTATSSTARASPA